MTTDSNLIYRGNYFLVQDFLKHLDGKKKDPKTIERYRSWLNHLLLWAMDVPLERFPTIQPSFSSYVENLHLAQESQKKIVETARALLRWAKLYHERQFMHVPYHKIEDLTPVKGQKAKVGRFVHIDEMDKLAALTIDKSDLALWRDQAMACMLFLSGARASAAVTLPIKAVHLNETNPYIQQLWDEWKVRTKNKQSATTYLHKISNLLDIAYGWDEFVRANFPEDHLWYAPIDQKWGEQTVNILTPGYCRDDALRKRLTILSGIAGIPYKSPHQYRHGYALYGLQRCQTMEQYHALSRNMMHSNISITDQIYVYIEVQERGRILSEIYKNPIEQPDSELASFVMRLSKQDLPEALRLIANRWANS